MKPNLLLQLLSKINNPFKPTERSTSVNAAKKKSHAFIFPALFIILTISVSSNTIGQTQLIPVADGGFENGTSTFAANGWSEAQPGNTRQWWVGTAAGSSGGSKAAYAGSNSNHNGSNQNSVQHFYRDVVIPSGATNVQLTFYEKYPNRDNGNDFLYVYRTTTANTPVSGTIPGAGYTQLHSNTNNRHNNFTLINGMDLSALAGTTVRLVFTYVSNGSGTNANPAIDDVSLTCMIPPTITSFTPSSGCGTTASITITGTNLASASAVTIGGTAVSSITSNTATQIVAVVGSGATGTVSVTTSGGSGNGPGTFTVNITPTAYTVFGGGTYCSTGSGLNVGLTNSQVGVNYQLYNGASAVGSAVAGTGFIINFGLQTVAGTYTVVGTSASGGCTTNQTGSAVIIINTAPSISVNPLTQSKCIGESVTFSVTAAGTSPGYQWRKNGSNISGANASTYTIPSVNAGDAANYDVVVSVTSCSSITSSAATLTVNTLPNQYNVTGGGTICSTGPGAAVGLNNSASGVNYQLYLGGIATGSPVAGTGVAISFGAQLTAGTYTVVATNATSGCTRNQNGTAVVVVNTAPSISVDPASQSKCVGQSVTFSVTAAGTSPSYQWRKGGVAIGGATSSSYTIASLVLGDAGSYDVVVSVSICSSVTSVAATLTVNSLPTVYNVTGGGSNCLSVAVGLSGSQSGVNYTLSPGGAVVSGTGSAISFGGQTSSATYTATATNATTGCTSNMTGNAIVVITGSVPAITTQPTDQTNCIGNSVSFTVTASGGSLTYQWKKGTTNITNGGTVSGATTATLTISAVALGDVASDYNCEVSNACGSDISDYVSLTIGTSAVAPVAQPTTLAFPTIGVSSFIGTFSASTSASYYLIVRRTTNVAPSNPVNGTTYAVGSSALGAGTYVEQSSTDSTFSSNGLTQGTTYYYWIYAYNIGACGTSPVYYTTSPLTGSATTLTNVVCGSVTTLYWAGRGSAFTGASGRTVDFNTASNWSTTTPSYSASASAPSACTSIDINLTSSATITLSANASVYALTFTHSAGGSFFLPSTGYLSVEGYTLTVNDVANIDVANSVVQYGNVGIGDNSAAGSGIVDFKSNCNIGVNYAAWGSNKRSYIRGNVNSKVIFRGDVLFGRTCTISSSRRPGTVDFDGIGLQEVLWNNDMYFANFNNVVIGNANNPICRHVTGTYTPDNIMGNLTVNGSSTLDLATSQWIRDAAGGTFSLNSTAKLVLGNNLSIVSPSSGLGLVIPGSNFPGFSTINLASGSTVEYDADNTLTQTVYATPTYGQLTLTNSSGTGTSNRITTAVVTISGTTEVKSGITFTPGTSTGVVTNGTFNVNSGATIVCASNIVSGSGTFNLKSGGTISLGSTQGITSSGATGNITTTTRSFSTGANYIYLSTGAANTGNGLPTTVNDLTISNSSGVTLNAASANYTVAGTMRLTSGSFVINGNTLTVNNLVRTAGSLRGSTTSSLTITGTGAPLFFTAGGRIIKDFTLGNNASGTLLTDMEIPGGSSAGSVAIGSGATLTTNSRLILRSTATGSARVAQIPVDGSGNALGFISGVVQVERYISARKAWRLLSVTTSGAQTINAAWQEGQAANVTNPAGYGIQITGPYFPNGFDLYTAQPSVKMHDPATNLWTSISGTNIPFVDGQAYMTFVRGDRTVNTFGQAPTTTILRTRGTLITGNRSAVAVAANQFKSMANPYASSINFKTVSKTAVDDKFYVWDPNLGTFGGYQTFIKNGSGDYEIVLGGGSYGSAGTVYNEIQNGQAFMVYSTGSAGTVSLREADKSNGSVSVSRNDSSSIVSNNKQLRTKLFGIAADGTSTLIDGVLNKYNATNSNQIDNQDAAKGISFGENLSLKTDGKLLVVDSRREILDADTIYFNLSGTKVQQYKFQFTPANLSLSGLSAYFEDSYLQTRQPLNLADTSTQLFNIVNIAGSYAANRFRIVFKQAPALVFTSVNATRNQTTGPVSIDWTVANEAGVTQYEIQRSSTPNNFVSISDNSPVGNDGGTYSYNKTDPSPLRGISYYRIKAVQNNNVELYSSIVKLAPGKDQFAGSETVEVADLSINNIEASSINLYPNPVVNKIVNVQFNNQSNGTYKLELNNQLGETVFRKEVRVNSNHLLETLKLERSLTAGNYQLRITAPDHTITVKQVMIQ